MKTLDLNRLSVHIDSSNLGLVIYYQHDEYGNDTDKIATIPLNDFINPNDGDELDWDLDKIDFYPTSGDLDFYETHKDDIISYVPALIAKTDLS